jgi:hypothetical protein
MSFQGFGDAGRWPFKVALGSPWPSISPIDQTDTGNEAPMTVDVTPAQIITSLLVFYGKKPVASSLRISTAIPKVPSQVQRRETFQRKNEPLLLCMDNDSV